MDEVKRLQDALEYERDEMDNQRMLVQTIKSKGKLYQSEIAEMKRIQVGFQVIFTTGFDSLIIDFIIHRRNSVLYRCLWTVMV